MIPLFDVAQKAGRSRPQGRVLHRAQTLSECRLLFGSDLPGSGNSRADVHGAVCDRQLPGWIAHWREMHANPATRINRPRQVYTGFNERDFVPIEKRP